jgi:hypothetical protein
VVLLRKRFPQKPNLQTAAVLSVIKLESLSFSCILIVFGSVVLKSLSAFAPACGHEFYSLSRSPDCAKFSAGLMKFVGFLKFILLGCSSIKSVRF